MAEGSARMTLKDRMALLSQNPGGIVLPQVAGAPPPVPRLTSRESRDEFSDRAKSESNLLSQGGSSYSLNSQSERSISSIGEAADIASEASDKFDVDASLNAAALSKPIMAPGRRRPSRVENLVAAIPAENRLNEKDLALIAEEPKTEEKVHVPAEPPGALTTVEQWLLLKLNFLEKDYQQRVASLEQEIMVLRDALKNNGIAVPPRATISSAASTPQVTITKKPATLSASPSSPLQKKVPTPPVKRSDSADSTASSTSVLRRMSSESSSAPLSPSRREPSDVADVSGPARKVPAVPQGPRPIPSAPKSPTESDTSIEAIPVESEPTPASPKISTVQYGSSAAPAELASESSQQTNPGSPSGKAGEATSTATGTTAQPGGEDDDDDSDLADML